MRKRAAASGVQVCVCKRTPRGDAKLPVLYATCDTGAAMGSHSAQPRTLRAMVLWRQAEKLAPAELSPGTSRAGTVATVECQT
jgi:hypothetical protein